MGDPQNSSANDEDETVTTILNIAVSRFDIVIVCWVDGIDPRKLS